MNFLSDPPAPLLFPALLGLKIPARQGLMPAVAMRRALQDVSGLRAVEAGVTA